MFKVCFKDKVPGPISKRRRKVATAVTLVCSPIGVCVVNCTVKQMLVNNLLWHLGIVPGIIHGLILIRKLPDKVEEGQNVANVPTQAEIQYQELCEAQERYKQESICSDYDQETLVSKVT